VKLKLLASQESAPRCARLYLLGLCHQSQRFGAGNLARKLTNTLVRKPGAGDRHARFDERDLETESFGVTAPDLDSTPRLGERGAPAVSAADGTLALERPPRGRKANLAIARHLVQEWS
jgi:hypothetical protein